MVKSIQILGVRIDNLRRAEFFKQIDFFLEEKKFHHIATVNPEFILEAQKNDRFRQVLNECDLNVADGVGICFASLRSGQYLKCRLAGADLMLEILKMAQSRGLGVYLACRDGGLSTFEETREAITKKYPRLRIGGEDIKMTSRSFTDVQFGKNEILDFDIIFANFGAPYQEAFIKSVKSDKIRLAMGVGGSFDFLTGKIKRAPLFLRRAGLEWLWRLLQQPSRIKRTCRAVVIFSLKAIFQ